MRHLVPFFSFLLAVGLAYANDVPIGSTPAACGQGGNVFENANRPATFKVFLSDCHGNQIGRTPFRTVAGMHVTVPVPGTFMNTLVGDAHNITTFSGESADLLVESLYVDSTTHQVNFESVFGRLQSTVGTGVPVTVPDLYADTNGDGRLDAGDLLYSLVDIHQYAQSPPSFSLGETFTIVDGQVSTLPGMLFSTTPFVYDPSAPTGFDFTGYDGDGTAESEHTVEATPEPASLPSVACGILLLLGAQLARRKPGLLK